MEDFEIYYPLLATIAHRILGSTNDVEDMVQESYVRYATTAVREISSLKAYLIAITTRLCLDYLKSARVQRELSLESVMIETLLTDDLEEVVIQDLERREEISRALRILLECLTSDERVVFLLHEVFTCPYEEIAAILGKSASTCRQLFHRGKRRIAERHTRFAFTPDVHERLLLCFLALAQQGDLQPLHALALSDRNASRCQLAQVGWHMTPSVPETRGEESYGREK